MIGGGRLLTMLSQNLHRFKNVPIPDVSKTAATCVKDATKQFMWSKLSRGSLE
eukprot:TRINITY_DN4167_c0_g1_i1.p5 TRINITY_DN4167_c0_g1~~TRINITY_DN4167_c0_g1_i1.p5  ORF type:complete len:53 (+),score=4.83 TRINITY_DN4167_c0_g1_i1:275-433(+)